MDGNILPEGYTEQPKRKGISGSTLKLVAIITMLIDHTAATILDHILMTRGMNSLDATDVQAVQQFYIDNGLLMGIDTFMRLVGRIAFPIFCFLLVEGMVHTRNKMKYAIRLGLFALISEVPFDLAFANELFYWDYQSVYFTLLIGLLVMIGFSVVSDKLSEKKWLPAFALVGVIATGLLTTNMIQRVLQFFNSIILSLGSDQTLTMNTATYLILVSIFSVIALIVFLIMSKKITLQRTSVRFADLAILVAGFLLADFLKTDYSGFGILTIAIMYGLRRSHFNAMLGGCISLTVMSISEVPAFLDLILIRMYNGTRGMNMKYVFYLFYPVHLFILYLICYFMNIL